MMKVKADVGVVREPVAGAEYGHSRSIGIRTDVSISIRIEGNGGTYGGRQDPIVGALDKAMEQSRRAVVDAITAAS